MSYPQVLMLNKGGYPIHWASWQDAVTAKVKGIVSWSIGEITFDVHGGTRRVDGERTIVTIPSIMALNNEHKNTRTPVLNNTNLFRRDINVCAYCGRTFQYERLSRDHVHPVSKGGKDIWTNVVTACKPCNNEKGNSTLQQLGWELIYVPYVPDRAEQLILQNRRILVDQMDFLKSFVPQHSRVHKLIVEH